MILSSSAPRIGCTGLDVRWRYHDRQGAEHRRAEGGNHCATNTPNQPVANRWMTEVVHEVTGADHRTHSKPIATGTEQPAALVRVYQPLTTERTGSSTDDVVRKQCVARQTTSFLLRHARSTVISDPVVPQVSRRNDWHIRRAEYGWSDLPAGGPHQDRADLVESAFCPVVGHDPDQGIHVCILSRCRAAASFAAAARHSSATRSCRSSLTDLAGMSSAPLLPTYRAGINT